MGVVIKDWLASSVTDAVVAAFDYGAAAATLAVYVGSLPADLDVGADVQLLQVTLADPSAGPADDGVATFDVSTPIEGVVSADGVPGYLIIFDSDGGPVLGGNVGLASNPEADAVTDSLTWLTGETVSLDAGTLTTPLSG
jgi:hypothetical protein